MEVTIRKMGNSQGVLIPKPILARLGRRCQAPGSRRRRRAGLARTGRRGRRIARLVMKTGEIRLAQLDPTVGGEFQKTRRCVVVSPDDMNAHLRTVIVAPMSTGSRPAALRVPLTLPGQQGLIVLDRIRTLDRARLVERLGALRAPTLAPTLQTLQAMFAA